MLTVKITVKPAQSWPVSAALRVSHQGWAGSWPAPLALAMVSVHKTGEQWTQGHGLPRNIIIPRWPGLGTPAQWGFLESTSRSRFPFRPWMWFAIPRINFCSEAKASVPHVRGSNAVTREKIPSFRQIQVQREVHRWRHDFGKTWMRWERFGSDTSFLVLGRQEGPTVLWLLNVSKPITRRQEKTYWDDRKGKTLPNKSNWVNGQDGLCYTSADLTLWIPKEWPLWRTKPGT